MAEQNYHWETSKENVLPLKQGRTVAAIEETFQQNSSKGKVNEKIEREKRYFYAQSVVYSSRVSLSFAFVLGKKKRLQKSNWFWKILTFSLCVTERNFRAHLNEIANYDGEDPLEVWLRCGSLFSFLFCLSFLKQRFRFSRGVAGNERTRFYYVLTFFSLSLSQTLSLC